jgi:diaminohydroxyphosphoribosylaminopyrimidine deaminase/5-amino-6-(5-phosphoribosylamino)uracil reductase
MMADQQEDTIYMTEALRLAEKARGWTSPNPMVGAVLVKDGRIIGKGYHTKVGAPHAEIEAFQDAQENLQGATLYVTLEPCCSYGKTSPCTDAIIHAGIRRVVAAMIDPNPKVSGKGIRQLRDAEIEVEVGLLEPQARRLNEAFIKYQTTGLPFVIAKFAMSLDGKIATKTGESKYLTNEASRAYVHTLRDQVDAIMVGIGTVLADDPLLTIRLPDASGKNPYRIIVDTRLSIPLNSKVVTDTSEAKTVIFTGEQSDQQKARMLRDKGVDIQTVAYDEQYVYPPLPPFRSRAVKFLASVRGEPVEPHQKSALRQAQGERYDPDIPENLTALPFRRGGYSEEYRRLNLRKVFEILGKQEMLSVLLEGGAELNGSAFMQRLVDKVLVFIAPMIIGGKEAQSPVEGIGIETLREAVKLTQVTAHRFGDDILVEGYVERMKD